MDLHACVCLRVRRMHQGIREGMETEKRSFGYSSRGTNHLEEKGVSVFVPDVPANASSHFLPPLFFSSSCLTSRASLNIHCVAFSWDKMCAHALTHIRRFACSTRSFLLFLLLLRIFSVSQVASREGDWHSIRTHAWNQLLASRSRTSLS